MKNYRKNAYGLKNSNEAYRNINGKYYEQWSDFKTLEECQTENPQEHFIARKIDDFVRIYREVYKS